MSGVDDVLVKGKREARVIGSAEFSARVTMDGDRHRFRCGRPFVVGDKQITCLITTRSKDCPYQRMFYLGDGPFHNADNATNWLRAAGLGGSPIRVVSGAEWHLRNGLLAGSLRLRQYSQRKQELNPVKA